MLANFGDYFQSFNTRYTCKLLEITWSYIRQYSLQVSASKHNDRTITISVVRTNVTHDTTKYR